MNPRNVTRRRFLRTATYAGAIAATSGATVLATRRFARQRKAETALEKNPFAYEVSSQSKAGLKLLAYREANRFPVARADARRIACGPDEGIYVAAGSYVTVLDASGSTLNELALSAPARCVAVTEDCLVYVGVRDRVEVFNTKGRRQSDWVSVAPRSWFT